PRATLFPYTTLFRSRERAEPAFDVQTRRLLTPRERRVLFELARGRTTRAAATAIGLSPHTVRSHLKSALHKLGAETRTQAVALRSEEHTSELQSREN